MLKLKLSREGANQRCSRSRTSTFASLPLTLMVSVSSTSPAWPASLSFSRGSLTWTVVSRRSARLFRARTSGMGSLILGAHVDIVTSADDDLVRQRRDAGHEEMVVVRPNYDIREVGKVASRRRRRLGAVITGPVANHDIREVEPMEYVDASVPELVGACRSGNRPPPCTRLCPPWRPCAQ